MGTSIKILIVDDEASFCRSMKEFLHAMGYEALYATSGEEAMRLIEGEKPALMTLDMRMPGMNGYDMLEKLSRMESKPKIVVISAIDLPEMEERMLYAGAQAVLHKPINLADLLGKIKELVG